MRFHGAALSKEGAEIDQLMEIGPEAFSEFLYPEDGGEMHYLSERYRSEKF